jgi:hypothetical protein
MRTYPLLDAQGRLVAFEVSSLLGRRLARRVAASISGARIVSTNLGEDRFCEFEIGSSRFAIEEPFGDNSRFWVGPVNALAVEAIERVQVSFSKNRTGTWAVRIGALLCCVLVALPFYQPVRQYIQQDRCLDNGGRWNKSVSKCEGARNGG